jgi:hypothetical protein
VAAGRTPDVRRALNRKAPAGLSARPRGIGADGAPRASCDGAAITAQILHTTRELHSRVSDGIHVRMLWNEHDRRVTVTVVDDKTPDAFVVEVLEGERAKDVFHHPYAYAAWHGIETTVPLPIVTQAPDRLAA